MQSCLVAYVKHMGEEGTTHLQWRKLKSEQLSSTSVRKERLLKPVWHKTLLGTRFKYDQRGYKWVNWYEY